MLQKAIAIASRGIPFWIVNNPDFTDSLESLLKRTLVCFLVLYVAWSVQMYYSEIIILSYIYMYHPLLGKVMATAFIKIYLIIFFFIIYSPRRYEILLTKFKQSLGVGSGHNARIFNQKGI